MFCGAGSELTEHDAGEIGGTAEVTLADSEIQVHKHALMAAADRALLPAPGPTRSLAGSRPSIYRQRRGAAPPQPLAPEAVGPSGGGQPHNNMMPFVTLNFCIALQGISPPRA